MSLFVIATAVVSSACLTAAPRAPDQDYRNFQTAVASASKDGYTPYWLGRGFTAGGLSFTGPRTPDFGAEVEGGGANFTYNADVLDGRGSVGLDITLYSTKAWDKVQAVQDVAPGVVGVTVTDVTIAGRPGRVLEKRNGLGTLEQIRLIVTLGDTTVLGIATRGTPLTPGPGLNPLTDKQTFISALQNLRPYPQ
jgi:hypothetical protein